MVEHLRAVLLTQTAGAEMIEASPDERALYTEQAAQIARALLVRAIRAFNEAVNSYKGGWQPQLSLELALIDSLTSEPELVTAQPVAQQSAPPQNQQAAEAVPVRSDATPVVPSGAINEKWDKVLRAMYRYSKTSPDVMRYFKAQRVEGSTVFLCTDNETYYKRIQPYPGEAAGRRAGARRRVPRADDRSGRAGQQPGNGSDEQRRGGRRVDRHERSPAFDRDRAWRRNQTNRR